MSGPAIASPALPELRFGVLVGESPSMRRLYRLLEQVGPSSASVLITGESGTGKELVARTLHALSPRREGPFVALNCAAIPESLLESELFGHERGAFTGAETERPGCFELASGGTLFLDEIGDMPRSLQKKLLRVIEERRLRRLGARVETPVDVRIVSATHADLATLLRRGVFRADLYYRLDVFTVEMVPLRRRPGDVPLLAHHFLARLARENGKTLRGFAPDALDRLAGHDWPGNVRELRNAVERAVVVCEGDRVETRHLPRPVRGRSRRRSREGVFVPGGTPLDEAERMLVDHALEREGGNKTRAARSLGIAVRTLHRKLERWREEGREA